MFLYLSFLWVWPKNFKIWSMSCVSALKSQERYTFFLLCYCADPKPANGNWRTNFVLYSWDWLRFILSLGQTKATHRRRSLLAFLVQRSVLILTTAAHLLLTKEKSMMVYMGWINRHHSLQDRWIIWLPVGLTQWIKTKVCGCVRLSLHSFIIVCEWVRETGSSSV